MACRRPGHRRLLCCRVEPTKGPVRPKGMRGGGGEGSGKATQRSGTGAGCRCGCRERGKGRPKHATPPCHHTPSTHQGERVQAQVPQRLGRVARDLSAVDAEDGTRMAAQAAHNAQVTEEAEVRHAASDQHLRAHAKGPGGEEGGIGG